MDKCAACGSRTDDRHLVQHWRKASANCVAEELVRRLPACCTERQPSLDRGGAFLETSEHGGERDGDTTASVAKQHTGHWYGVLRSNAAVDHEEEAVEGGGEGGSSEGSEDVTEPAQHSERRQ